MVWVNIGGGGAFRPILAHGLLRFYETQNVFEFVERGYFEHFGPTSKSAR